MTENQLEAFIERPLSVQKAIFTTPEAATYLGLAVSTLNKWRCYGEGPQFIKLGRAVRYRQNDLDTFVETGKRGSTGSRPPTALGAKLI